MGQLPGGTRTDATEERKESLTLFVRNVKHLGHGLRNIQLVFLSDSLQREIPLMLENKLEQQTPGARGARLSVGPRPVCLEILFLVFSRENPCPPEDKRPGPVRLYQRKAAAVSSHLKSELVCSGTNGQRYGTSGSPHSGPP